MNILRTNPCSVAFGAALVVASANLWAAPDDPDSASASLSAVPVIPCSVSGSAGKIKALGRSVLYTAHRDFSGGYEGSVWYPAGTFGAQPLFNTTFTAAGTTASCVLATLSVDAQPGDNGMVFQVRVDGKPMAGHWNPASFLQDTGNIPPNFNVPIVWLPNVVQGGVFDGVDPPHLAAYTFLANVTPGAHTIDVLVAGCCHQDFNPTPPDTPEGYIRSATLVLQHR